MSLSLVTQWEVPESLRAAAQPPSLPTSTASQLTSSSYPPGTTTGPTSTATGPTSSSDTMDERSLKRTADQAEVEERDVVQPPKRSGPYGGWTTVAVIERDVEQETPTAATEKEGGDEQTSQEEEQEVQFEEKKISGDLGEEFKGEFKGFSFKKRTNKDRPQIRQRIGDV